MKHQLSSSDVPCALLPYVSQKQKNKNDLSHLECRFAFQNWVAYTRTKSIEISSKERFVCPLLWCREFHNDLQSALDHVADCPRFNTGEYWCPHCCRPERFLGDHASPSLGQQDVVQRSESKLQRAKVFITKNLRLKSCTRNRSHSASPMANNIHSMDWNNTYGVSSKGELDASPLMESGFAVVELRNALGSNMQPSQEMPAPLPHELPATRGWDCRAEEEAEITSNLQAAYRECPDDYTKLDHTAPQFHIRDQDHWIGSWQQQPTPPKSQSSSQISSPTDTTESNRSELDSPLGNQSVVGADFSPISELAASPVEADSAPISTTRTKLPFSDERAAQASLQSPPVDVQVEELCHLEKIVYDEWKQRLSVAPEIRLRYPLLSADMVLRRGLHILQCVLRGTLPVTFEDVFAMMHVTVACTYIIHEHRDLRSWNNLLHDMMNWRHAIQDHAERRLFVRTMVQVLQTNTIQASHPTQMDGNLYRPRTSAPSDQLAPHHPSFASDVNAGRTKVASKTIGRPEDANTLLNRLKSGKVLSVCLDFLDKIAYADLLERSMFDGNGARWYAQQHPMNIKYIKHCTTRKLYQWTGLEAFRGEVADTENEISMGLLRSPREVEVKLLCRGHDSHKNLPVYNTYRKAIAGVFNNLMSTEGLSWRDNYHASNLDKVVAISLAREEPLCPGQLPTFEESIIARTSHFDQGCSPVDAHVPSHQSAVLEASHCRSLELPPPYSTLGAPAEDEHPVHIPHDGDSRATSSATPCLSQRSTCPTGVKVECPLCHMYFTKSNLPRHNRTHGQKYLIACPERHCVSTFTRQNNLDKHMRRKHPKFPLGRRGAYKGRRGSPQATLS